MTSVRTSLITRLRAVHERKFLFLVLGRSRGVFASIIPVLLALIVTGCAPKSDWTSLGMPGIGTFGSDPDACSWGIGKLAVVDRSTTSGNNGTINFITGTTTNGLLSWSSWASLGYPPQTNGVQGNATCASTADGTLTILVVGNDQAIYQSTFNGNNWSGWAAIPISNPGGSSPETIRGIDAGGFALNGLLKITVITAAAVWNRTWQESTGWSMWWRLGSTTNEMVGRVSSTATGPQCFAGYTCSPTPNWVNRTYGDGTSYIDSLINGGIGHLIGDPSPKVAGVDAAVDSRGRIHVAFLNKNRSVGVTIYDVPPLPSEAQHNLPFVGTLYSSAPITNYAPTITMYRKSAADTQGSEAVFVVAADNKLYVNFQNPTLVLNENLSYLAHNSYIWRGGDSAVDWNNGFTAREVLDNAVRPPANASWIPTIRNLEIDLHIMQSPSIGSACPPGRWAVHHNVGEYGAYNSDNCAFGPMGNDGAISKPGPITDLYNWHSAHPNHELVIVDFEIMHDGNKSLSSPGDGIDGGTGTGSHKADDFDNALTAIKPFLFTPKDFFAMCPEAGNPGTLKGLQNAIRQRQCNYPTLEELRGKIIVLLQNGVGPYFSDSPNGRLAFQLGGLADPNDTDTSLFYDDDVENSSGGALAQQRGQIPIASPAKGGNLPYFTGDTYGLSDSITPWVTGMVNDKFAVGARGILKADWEEVLWPGWTNHTGSSAPASWGGRLDNSSNFPFCPDAGKTNPNTLSADCQADLPGMVENLASNMTPNQARPMRGDSCRNAKTIFENRTSWTYSGTTFGRSDDFTGACGGSGAPDEIYILSLSKTKHITINTANSRFNTAVYIRDGAKTCPGTTETACSTFNYSSGTPGYQTSRAYIETTLTAGTYYVIVDGYAGEFGAYHMSVELIDVSP